MKRSSLFALAMLGSFAGMASAQSSVTLFGVVDASARSVKDGSAGTQKQLASGGLATSRFGVRGVEDLGGGLRAGFHLESGLNTDVGTADTTRFWGRRATVSLLGSWGELRLGRDYNPTAVNTFNEPFGVVGVGTVGNYTYGPTAGLGSGATTTLRNDNSIGYHLPALGGVYGSLMAAAGEDVAGNKYVGGRLGYAAGPVDVAIGYGRTETASNVDYDQFNIKALYDLGFLKLNFLYDVKEFDPREQKVTLIGVTAPVGVGEVRFAYAMNNRSGGVAGSGFGEADDSKMLAIGYVHNLSKRTAVYTTYGRIANDGAARDSVGFAPRAGMLGGQTSSGYELGVSHRF